jgi:hypothetical protein
MHQSFVSRAASVDRERECAELHEVLEMYWRGRAVPR